MVDRLPRPWQSDRDVVARHAMHAFTGGAGTAAQSNQGDERDDRLAARGGRPREHGTTTADGASLMTLRYAAPEQVRGERVGVGCDIHGLGLLLYELVAGASPYADVDGAAALTQAILHRDPAPPSQVAMVS